MQLAVPLVAAIYLLVKQKDWFGLVVGLSWLSFSMFELATYCAGIIGLVAIGGGGYMVQRIARRRLANHLRG